MIVRQSRATIERACLVAQMRVTVGLVQQRDRLSLPFFWINGFAATKVGQGVSVCTELAVNSPTRAKCSLGWSEFDDLVQIVERAPRLAQIAPYEMPCDVWAEVLRILPYPFIDNLKEALRIGAAELVEFQYFLG